MELALVSVDPSLIRPRRRRSARAAAAPTSPTLAVVAADTRHDGSPTPWLVNGHRARIRTWTAEEWAALAEPLPAVVQIGRNGVRVAFDLDDDGGLERLRDLVRGKLAPG